MDEQQRYPSGSSFSRVSEQLISGIEQQRWLDSIGRGLEKALAEVLRASGKTGRKVRDFLNGTWFGHPLHPALTDIPIGAWTASLVFDLLDAVSSKESNAYGKAADATIKIGAVGAVGAALSGLADWQHLHPPTQRVGTMHGLMNTAALVAYLASLRLRKNGSRGAGRLLSVLGYGLVLGSSYLGGDLVFRQGVGTDHADHSGEHRSGDDSAFRQASEWLPMEEKTAAP